MDELRLSLTIILQLCYHCFDLIRSPSLFPNIQPSTLVINNTLPDKSFSTVVLIFDILLWHKIFNSFFYSEGRRYLDMSNILSLLVDSYFSVGYLFFKSEDSNNLFRPIIFVLTASFIYLTPIVYLRKNLITLSKCFVWHISAIIKFIDLMYMIITLFIGNYLILINFFLITSEVSNI